MSLLSDIPLFVGLSTLTNFRSLHGCGSHGLWSSSYFALTISSCTRSTTWVQTDPVRWACDSRAPLEGCAAAVRGCPSQAVHVSTQRCTHFVHWLGMLFQFREADRQGPSGENGPIL